MQITTALTANEQGILDHFVRLGGGEANRVPATVLFTQLRGALHSELVSRRNQLLAGEQSIIWTRDVSGLGYLREGIFGASSASLPPHPGWMWDCEVVGYSIGTSGLGRCWYLLRPIDSDALDGFQAERMIDYMNWQSFCVLPSSIRPGEPSAPPADGATGDPEIESREEAYRDAVQAHWASYPDASPPGREENHVESY